MKTTKMKTLILSGIVLFATSLAFGQNADNPQKSKSKHHSTTNQQQLAGTRAVVGSGNSILDAGSSAQVRYERIGSLCPGNVSNVGKNSVRSTPKTKPAKDLNGIEQ